MKLIRGITRVGLRLLGALLLTTSALTGLLFVGGGTAGASRGNTYYASPDGSGSFCTSVVPCGLTTAIAIARNGSTVKLSAGTYQESSCTNGTTWTVSKPIKLEGASQYSTYLDGQNACTVLFTDPGASKTVDLTDLTVENGQGEFGFLSGCGGGVYVNSGALSVSDATFSYNQASWWGAGIANAQGSTGAVTVSHSVFESNSASYAGGAISSGAEGGSGTLTVTDSVFVGNSAQWGGAISSGWNATGALSVSGSFFEGDSGEYGGAIANGDTYGTSVGAISTSFFLDNGHEYGGAIDNGDGQGHGTLTISGSTFAGNQAFDGGSIDNGDGSGQGALTISESTFSGGSAYAGGAIDNADESGHGTLSISGSTFSGSTAVQGHAILSGANSGTATVYVAGDLFGATCDSVSGSWNDEGYNAGIDSSCENSGTSDVSDPSVGALGSLVNLGWQTPAIVPSFGNMAIGLIPASPTAVTLNGNSVQLCPVKDQTGHASAGACNAGSVQLVNQATLSVNAASGPYGKPLYLKATGGSGSGGITYSVSDPGTAGCTLQAGDTLKAATAGTCQVTATKYGSFPYLATTSAPQTMTFNQAQPTVLLHVSPGTGATTSSDVVLNATVRGPSGATQPTGTVSFYEDGSEVGSCAAVTLSSDASSCDLGTLAAGLHSFSAVYWGDGNYVATSSPLVSGYRVTAARQP